jgi:uncharacterized Zn-binding protein involved in type VI secretion
MGEYIANTDYELEITPVSPGTQEPKTPVEVRVEAPAASAPSGKPILVQQITYTFSSAPPAVPCVLSGYVFAGGAGVIPATATKTKCNGLAVMRENDQGACAGGFTQGPSSMACSCTLKIKSAGQSTVKAM